MGASVGHIHFCVCYHPGKLNVEDNTLSWLQWASKMELEAVMTVLNAAVEGPGPS